jgi:predicted negative regulator of RcsB-dependent stress response
MVQASEKEQIEVLKKWWKDNGSSVVTGVLLGLSLLLGGKAWQGYQQRQALSASNTYAQMMALAENGNSNEAQGEQIQALANELISHHSGSTYAALAALMLASREVDRDQLPAAQAQLQWALEHAGSEEIRHTARTRLIRVLIDQKMYEEADRQLAAVTDPGAYAYRYSELKGDLALARGQQSEAAAAYRQALGQLPAQAPNLALLTAKYESVGGSGDAP